MARQFLVLVQSIGWKLCSSRSNMILVGAFLVTIALCLIYVLIGSGDDKNLLLTIWRGSISGLSVTDPVGNVSSQVQDMSIRLSSSSRYFVFFMQASMFLTGPILHSYLKGRDASFWRSLPINGAVPVLAHMGFFVVFIPALVLLVMVLIQLLLPVLLGALFAKPVVVTKLLWMTADLPALWLECLEYLVVQIIWYFPFCSFFILVAAWVRNPVQYLAGIFSPLIVVAWMAWLGAGGGKVGDMLSGVLVVYPLLAWTRMKLRTDEFDLHWMSEMIPAYQGSLTEFLVQPSVLRGLFSGLVFLYLASQMIQTRGDLTNG